MHPIWGIQSIDREVEFSGDLKPFIRCITRATMVQDTGSPEGRRDPTVSQVAGIAEDLRMRSRPRAPTRPALIPPQRRFRADGELPRVCQRRGRRLVASRGKVQRTSSPFGPAGGGLTLDSDRSSVR